MCVTMNNLEYVRRALSMIPNELQVEALLESIQNNENYEGPYSEDMTIYIDECVADIEQEIGLITNRIGIKVRVCQRWRANSFCFLK